MSVRRRRWKERAWRAVKRVPLGRTALRAWSGLRNAWRNASSPYMRRYPVGHFYSPVPRAGAADRAREIRTRLGGEATEDGVFPGIDLRFEAQLGVLEEVADALACSPHGVTRPGGRYQVPNNYFGRSDGEVLQGLLHRHRPRRVVEVGSGYSTALMLDVTDALDHDVHLECVEPYPDRVLSLLRPGDRDRLELVRSPVQEVDPDVFRELEGDDVLFIDSTHVVKSGSDVLHLLTEVLPSLRPGVLVHLHDVFWPFEYPADWFRRGIAWNEAYFLRAFLALNPTFEIHLWPSALLACRPKRAAALLDLSEGSASFWMRKVS